METPATIETIAMPGPVSPVPLYVSIGANGSRFLTTNKAEAAPAGYSSPGVIGNVFTSQVPGTTPLYGFFRSSDNSYFYSTTNAVNNGSSGFAPIGVTCFIFPNTAPPAVPLICYYGVTSDDYAYDTNLTNLIYSEPPVPGYHYEGVAGYLLAP